MVRRFAKEVRSMGEGSSSSATGWRGYMRFCFRRGEGLVDLCGMEGRRWIDDSRHSDFVLVKSTRGGLSCICLIVGAMSGLCLKCCRSSLASTTLFGSGRSLFEIGKGLVFSLERKCSGRGWRLEERGGQENVAVSASLEDFSFPIAFISCFS